VSALIGNGAAAGKPAVPPEQQQVIDTLHEALVAAQSGLITSVAILSANSGGFNIAMAGPQVADLYLAAGCMQAKVVEVFQSPEPKTKSSIIRSR